MGEKNKGDCMRSNVFTVDCLSPAFDSQTLDIRKSYVDQNEYAIWTESKWDSVNLRIFVQPNPWQKYFIFIFGLFISIIFSTLFFFFKHNFDDYFESTIDTPNCNLTPESTDNNSENVVDNQNIIVQT